VVLLRKSIPQKTNLQTAAELNVIKERKMKILTILIGLTYLIGSTCNADTHQTGKISRVVAEGNRTVSVWLENQPTNAECPSDGRWVLEFQNDLLAKEKYSAILAAAVSKQVVGFHFMTSLGCGAFGAKKIYYVDLNY
jgi:hypothetical protein